MSDTTSRRLPIPPLVYLAALALAFGLQAVYPLPWFGQPLSDILFAFGLLSLAAAAALAFTAVRALRRARTTLHPGGTPDHLVTGGPYAVTRNPIYLALTLLVIGLGLALGHTWFLPIAVAAAFATRKIAIDGEEKVLAERFGKRYRDYAKKVRRWI